MTTRPWWISGTGALLVHLIPWVWFAYCISVPVFTILINVCITHVAGVCNDIADSSHFQMDKFRKLAPKSKYCLTTYLHGLLRFSWPPLAMLVSWHCRIHMTEIPIWTQEVWVILQSVRLYSSPSIIPNTAIIFCLWVPVCIIQDN